MFWFLAIYISFYGGINLYIFWRLSRAYELTASKNIFLAGWFILMVLAPILVRLFERWGAFALARVVAFAGFSWMALAMWMFLLLGVIEIVKFFMWILHFKYNMPTLDWRTACTISLGIVLILALVSTIVNFFLIEKTVELQSDKMPAGSDPVRVVQISDVHLGLVARQGLMRQLIARIETMKPDLLLCTGDLVDAAGDHLDVFVEDFRKVKPRLGKFAILGNHEMYAGMERSLQFLNESGFVTLRESSTLLDGWLRVCGVDDLTVAETKEGSALSDEERALQDAGPDEYVILMKHRPKIDAESLPKINLQLSGHTHNGQIFPFNFFVMPFYKYVHGAHILEHETLLYVNRGTGSWGPPMRLFFPREITLFVISPSQ